MKNLKKFLLSNLSPFVPFSFLSSKVTENWGKWRSKEEKIKTNINTILSAVVVTGGLLYGILASEGKSLDYRKWEENKEKARIESLNKRYDAKMERFYILDKNEDGVLDSTEFCY